MKKTPLPSKEGYYWINLHRELLLVKVVEFEHDGTGYEVIVPGSDEYFSAAEFPWFIGPVPIDPPNLEDFNV
jgi:hypothetical protein